MNITEITTLKHAMAACREVGYVLRKIDGEYQCKPRTAAWTDECVYYTDDMHDAVETAQASARS